MHICWARTFGYSPFIDEATTLRKLPGFVLTTGARTDANMIIWQDDKYVTELRRVDEPVRHKVLDWIGDLALVGAPLQAKVSLKFPGHALNALVATQIYADLPTSAPDAAA